MTARASLLVANGLVQFVTMKIQFNFTDSALWPNRSELSESADHKLTKVVGGLHSKDVKHIVNVCGDQSTAHLIIVCRA